MNLLMGSVKLSATPKAWNLLATTGKFQYAEGARTITEADLRSAVDFFNQVNAGEGSDVLIDYDHAVLMAARGELNPKDVDAAGWIDQLEVREGDNGLELWQHQTWTAAALAKIEAKEKRYLSHVLIFGAKHPVTGKRVRCMLHSVGLTNTPLLRHLPAVAASELGLAALDLAEHTPPKAFVGFAVHLLVEGAEPMAVANPYPNEHSCRVADPDEFTQFRRKTVADGISLILGKRKNDEWDIQAYRFDAEKWTPERARKWLAEHNVEGTFEPAEKGVATVDPKELAKLLGLAEDADEEAIKAKVGELVAAAAAEPPLVAAAIAELLGVKPDADIEAVKAAVETLKQPADDGKPNIERVVIANSLGLDGDAELNAIQAKIKTLIGSVAVSEAEKLVASAIEDGKVRPADKETWLSFAEQNLEGAKTAIANMAPIVGGAGTTAPPDDGTLTKEDKQVADQLGVDHDKLAESKAAS